MRIEDVVVYVATRRGGMNYAGDDKKGHLTLIRSFTGSRTIEVFSEALLRICLEIAVKHKIHTHPFADNDYLKNNLPPLVPDTCDCKYSWFQPP